MGGIFYNFNKNNKIVIAADIFPPDIGGPATYSRKLADELVKKNWQVQLICYSDKQQEDKYSFYVNRIIRRKNNANTIFTIGPATEIFPFLRTSKYPDSTVKQYTLSLYFCLNCLILRNCGYISFVICTL